MLAPKQVPLAQLLAVHLGHVRSPVPRSPRRRGHGAHGAFSAQLGAEAPREAGEERGSTAEDDGGPEPSGAKSPVYIGILQKLVSSILGANINRWFLKIGTK